MSRKNQVLLVPRSWSPCLFANSLENSPYSRPTTIKSASQECKSKNQPYFNATRKSGSQVCILIASKLCTYHMDDQMLKFSRQKREKLKVDP
jgi:hypothetical protein